MNDEIKEILDDLDYCSARKRGTITLNHKDCALLLDCITNLRQENKSLKGNCKVLGEKDNGQRKAINKYIQEIEKLQTNVKKCKQENERLKELIDADNESYDIQETIINRQKSELLEQEDYKLRVEKAVEYIKGWQSFPHTNGSTHNELRNLLNILQGENNE